MNKINYKDINSVIIVQSTYGTVKYLLDDLNAFRNIKTEAVNDISVEGQKLVMRKSSKTKNGIYRSKVLGIGMPTNALIILNGGAEINMSSVEFLIHEFASMNEWLSEYNVHIGIIRGANDDPSLFAQKPINFSNVKMYDDTMIVSCGEKKILCIGGGCSIDKAWKLNKEKHSNCRLYYANDEHPTFDINEIKDFLSKEMIDSVVTALTPTFVGESYSSMKGNRWLKDNVDSLEDINTQRAKMDELYVEFVKSGKLPERWYTLPFFSNISFTNGYNDICFISQKYNTSSSQSVKDLKTRFDDMKQKVQKKNRLSEGMDFDLPIVGREEFAIGRL